MSYNITLQNLINSVVEKYESRNNSILKLLNPQINKLSKRMNKDEDDDEITFEINKINKLIESLTKNDEVIIKLLDSLMKNFDKINVDDNSTTDKSFDSPLSD